MKTTDPSESGLHAVRGAAVMFPVSRGGCSIVVGFCVDGRDVQCAVP